MKDYAISEEERKKFILNYTIENNQIIINTANGKKYIVPYTKENENKIIERMKEQVKSAYYNKFKESANDLKDIVKCGLLITTIISVIFTGAFGFTKIIDILLCINSALAVMFVSLLIEANKRLKDYQKTSLFLKNEKDLNEQIKLNTNILSNVKKKTKEFIESKKEKPVLTINDTDKIGYKELKKMIEAVEYDNDLGIEYPEIQEDKPKTLQKKIGKNSNIY